MNLTSYDYVKISLLLFQLMCLSGALPSQLDHSFNAEDQTNGDTAKTAPSRSVYDILASIEERIRLLEAYENTYKLTRIDFTMEQMAQRMMAIESKMSRMEVALDMKMAKVEEMMDSGERRSELRSESVCRKIQNLSDRIETKSSEIGTKLETKCDQNGNKLEALERYNRRNWEDVTEKLTKREERHVVFESHVKSHIVNIESLVKHSLDANTNIKDMVAKDFQEVDKLVDAVKEAKQSQTIAVNRLTAIANHLHNTSIQHLQPVRSSNCAEDNLRSITEWPGYEPNDTSASNATNGNPRTIADPKNDFYYNISKSLQELKQSGVEEKLTQLDVHIDYFSRKIINTIQEIWRSSQASENYLRDALEMANKTRSVIRQELNRLQELIGPLIRTHDLSDIREPLEQKLNQLSTTIDDSFNALMISQNSFISSCTRIQEEEEQLYDILDDMLMEIRNKTNVDVVQTNQLIVGLTELFNRSMDHLDQQIETIGRQISEIKDQIQVNAGTGQSGHLRSAEECFLTRSQLIGVCDRHKNTNSEAIDEKTEPNYEDITQTE